MKVRDAEEWSLQVSEFEADESSRKFRDFLVLWVECAEGLMSESVGVLHPVDALYQAFAITEGELGFLSVEWLGQMLLVVVQHWVEGPRVWESLTPFERRLVDQATALKLAELQQSAAGD